ncbi:MAG: T9SS type A sorting domain-containing protein [Schleiferiaceae bacterium]|jgi:hypothetical protein|nr:T9SS type A sorting domain-containing protein [Schleiferiaceae bacterium]
MKLRILGFFVLFLSFGMYAQMPESTTSPIDTLFMERFDPPSGPDSVKTYNNVPGNTKVWNDTNFLSTSAPMSYHAQTEPFDILYFETDSFSTLGKRFVRLKFSHICKIYFLNKGFIQVSVDSGNTWVSLDSNHYQGNSPNFKLLGYFYENSYPSQTQTPYWGGPTIVPPGATPTNQWWANETFDISDIAGTIQPNGDTGYADVRVRFALTYGSGQNIASGWYVDDLLVEGSPCELQEPTINWNLIPQRYPIGARYSITEKVRFEAEDNAGLDSALIHYRFNGGPWQTAKMNPLSTPTCNNTTTTIQFDYDITNIALHDSVDWYVEIFDCSCPNVKRDPVINILPNYYTFWRNVAPPPICGTATPGSFPNVVDVFPWTEDFENAAYWVPGTGAGSTGTTHRGDFPTTNPPNGLNWAVAPNPIQPGYAWSVRNAATATNQTGPNSNHTPGGSNFLYTEASQGNNNATTQLVTPCIDLTNVPCAGLEFYYHMYGNDINRLVLIVDTGTNTSVYTPNIWKQIGAVQTNSNDPWQRAFVSLEEFAGKTIRLNFVGKRGNGDKGDIAIDDLRIYEPQPVDMEIVNYFTPENGYCEYSSNDSVTVKVRSTGCVTQSKIPIGYSVKTLPNGPTTVTWDTVYGNIKTGFETDFKFGVGANLLGYNHYEIYTFTNMPGDGNTSNDTLGPFYVDHEQPYNTWPYVATHDASPWVPGNGTATNPGTFDTTLFMPVPFPTSGQYSWMVGTQLTPTTNTGPRRDRSYTGNYIYTEGDFGGTNALLVSRCMDLTGMTNPSLDFWYHMYGTGVGAIFVQIKKPGENGWSLLPGAVISGQQQQAEVDPWKFKHFDLTTYANQIIQIRIIGQKSGAGTMADIAIDDLTVYDQGATDVGVVLVGPPKVRIDLLNPVLPKMNIRNFGRQAVSNIPIEYTITPSCGPNAGVPVTYNDTYTGTIQPGTEVVFTASSMPTYPKGDFEFCAKTNKTGDNISHNDGVCSRSVGWPEEFIQNGFYEDFDNCITGGSYLGAWPSGDLRIFEVGTPMNSPITAAASAPNAAMSGLAFNYFASKEEYYNLPRFVGFDTIAGAQIRFDHSYALGAADAITFEYFIGGQWVILGFPGSSFCPTWYNGSNIPALNSGNGWTGSLSGNWESTCWPLAVFNYSQAPFISRFRLTSTTGTNAGWAIDNLEIYIPPQNSAAPKPGSIRTVENIPVPDQDNHMQVKILNSGAKNLDSCLVQYSVDGGNTWSPPELAVFNPPILPGRDKKYEFLTKWTAPPSGNYNVCVVTSRPNNKQDNLTTDDTLCESIVVPDKIIMAQDSSYCNDFEDPSQTDWLVKNSFYTDGGLFSWEEGTPNQAPIIGASNGQNAWMTNLDSNYRQRDSSAVHTPFFVVDSGVTYKMSFMHNISSEVYHDGGNVEVSHDGGITWYTVGDRLPTNTWYSHDHITALDVIRPGWSGESNGWVPAEINIKFDATRTSIFRFRFGADHSWEYAGWAIDEFCFAATSDSPDCTIGIDDQNLDNIGIGNVIPNPTSGDTYIPFVMNKSGNVKVSAVNMLGQKLMEVDQDYELGENRVDFNVSTWSKGVYFVIFEFEGMQHTRKMIVQ